MTKVNPVEMKNGITTFKGLRNGRLLIKTQNKKEIHALRKQSTKCVARN